mgnify:FL=1
MNLGLLLFFLLFLGLIFGVKESYGSCNRYYKDDGIISCSNCLEPYVEYDS